MNSPVAILLSGQGTQHPGMFDLVAQAPEARSILAEARNFLGGKDPAQFVREADEETLYSNRNGQILCCTQALAAWAILRPHLQGRVILAGYSVGELAAWGCAGLFPPSTLLQLAAARAELMDEAGGKTGGLLAIAGLDQASVQALCAGHDSHIAIINGKDLFLIGGARRRLELLGQSALQAGATRVSPLRVAVASHTPLLAEASRRFGEVLEDTPITGQLPENIRLVSGIDGDAVIDLTEGKRKLAAQISHTVNWAACLDECRAGWAETFLELGPGHAMAGMARDLFPQSRIHSIDDFRSLDGLTSWLNRQS